MDYPDLDYKEQAVHASSSPARRVLRFGLIALGALVALAVIAVVVFVLTFNPNSYKPRIIAAVQAATGRTLLLSGPIGLKLSLHPTLEAKDVALENPPGFSRPDMIRLGALDLQLSLPALLHGAISIEQLVLIRPDILLERTKAGAVNWRLTPPAAARSAAPAPAGPAAAPATPARTPAIFVHALRIEDGTLTYRDDSTGKQTTIALRQARLSAASPSAPLQLSATATVNGAPVVLRASTGPLAALQRPAGTSQGAPWPLQLALRAGSARFDAHGTIAAPMAGRGVALALALQVPDLAALAPVTGMALPALHGIALTGTLDVPGTFAQGAQLNDLVLALPGGKLAGSLTLSLGAVPKLAGTLTSPGFDADTLLAALHGPAAAGKGPAGGGSASAGKPAGAPATGGPLFSSTPLPFGLLRLADADLHVSVTALRTGGQVWRNLAFHLVLAGGRLDLAPFQATPPAGPLALQLHIDAARPVPPVALTLHAPGLALASLMALAGQQGLATGNMAIEADLHGAGTSAHAIAAGLNGVVTATMEGGSIDNKVLDRLFGPTLARANLAGLLAHGGTSRIHCLALRLNARQGVGHLAPFLFASTLTTLEGSGTVALGPETLDLLMHVEGRAGGTGFAVPVRLRGPLRHPSAALSKRGAVSAGIGTALSLLQGGKLGVPADMQPAAMSCPQALALARGQRPPPVPAATAAPGTAPAAPAPGTAPNPANLLRNLFH